MLKKDVTAKIKERLTDIPDGKPFATRLVKDLGSRDSVDKALSRMVKKGDLTRVARGVYAKPQKGIYVKEVKPSPEAIARAVAESNDSEIGIHGAKALQLLGLSTQEPVQPVYVTNGPSRNIRYGKIDIQLKHVKPGKMPVGLRGKSALAFSALNYLGRHEVTLETLGHILRQLSDAEYESLLQASNKMPGWMSDMLLKANNHQNG